MSTDAKAKSAARSISDKLTNLAKKQKVPYESLLSSFLIERMAAHLVAEPTLAKALVFKGGFVSLRVYSSPRFTNDLDALLKKGKLKFVEERAKEAVEADLGDGVWFRFQESVDLKTQGEYGGLRLVFRAGVGPPPAKLSKARLLNLDIGTGDAVTPAPVATISPLLISQGELSWSVYPIETICSEKLHTLITRGDENSRAKDVYDLALFLPRCTPESLEKAMRRTFEARGDALPSDIPAAITELNTLVLKRGWKAAVAGIAGAPDFDSAFGEVAKTVRKLLKPKGSA